LRADQLFAATAAAANAAAQRPAREELAAALEAQPSTCMQIFKMQILASKKYVIFGLLFV
jgi:hypothetical protein